MEEEPCQVGAAVSVQGAVRPSESAAFVGMDLNAVAEIADEGRVEAIALGC